MVGLLPESASDESEIKDGLSDLARYLFGEIVLQAKPLNRDDHDSIFDAIDFDWSERLRALHSLADPVASAHELLLKLLADLEDIEIDSKDLDLVTHLREQVIQFINPATVDQVREFPRVLQGLGLVHLLDQYKASRGTHDPRNLGSSRFWNVRPTKSPRFWPITASILPPM